jgi:hypothetical protein
MYGATVTVVLALTVPELFVANSVYVVVEPGVKVYEPELETDPTDGEIVREFALLTAHDSVVACPG